VAKFSERNNRRYIRLDSVFPVDFRILALDGQTFLSDWIQGFTSNISRKGICLSVNNLKPEFVKLFQKGQINLLLNIQIPLFREATPAKAKPIWIEKLSNQPGQYLIGLSYTEISALSNKRIVGYAWMKYVAPQFSAALFIILALCIGISGYSNWRLSEQNRNLIYQLVGVLEDSKIAQDTINRIKQEKEELNLSLAQIQAQIKDAQAKRTQLNENFNQTQLTIEKKDNGQNAIQENARRLALLLDELGRERNRLQQELLNLQNKQLKADENLSALDKKKTMLQKVTFDNMYQWLCRHQNSHTGLVMSFEGDLDLANWSFTYDQALVACAYTYFANFQKVQKIFDFFKNRAKKVNGGFLNAYYANDGQPAEYTVHCGPNIWLGIAILQYTQASQNRCFLDLAEEIANWIVQIQDADGGIRGGPKIGWYSTEHNLDAYAFFNMLYEITGDQNYKKSAQKILNWLLEHTYNRPDVPVKRGKGDSTIATDTYAWSIAALGPKKLEEIGMLPEDIIRFAEDNFSIETYFYRPDGNVIRVKGFDFAASRNIARGGVISCEWTAQMILSFKILANYFQDKGMQEVAQIYLNKADDYLWQLSRMIICSPSPSGQGRGCLPYASDDFIDTGHGWMTPKGNSTGSVAATTYTLFAFYGHNPLRLPGNNLNDRQEALN
jgi:hypothetical protein